MEKTKNRSAAVCRAASVVILLLAAAFVFAVCRFTPPMGDDVLFQYTHSITYYLDTGTPELGEQVTNLPTLFEYLKTFYTNWTGRMVGYTIIPQLSALGETGSALLQAVCFAAMLWCTALLTTDSRSAALRSPLLLLAAFLLLVYESIAASFLLRFTFTSIYVVSVVLYFWYLFLMQRALRRHCVTAWPALLGLNVLGFFAGMSCEMFGIVCCLALGLRFLYVWLVRHEVTFRALLTHNLGLLLGLLGCCLSPGNYSRTQQAHDSAIAAPYFTKLADSFTMHLYAFGTRSHIGQLLQLLLAVLVLLSLVILVRRHGLRKWWQNNFEYVAACAASPFLWTFMAYVPHYGLALWSALMLVTECRCVLAALQCLREADALPAWLSGARGQTLRAVGGAICAAAMALCMAMNLGWLGELASVTLEREALVRAAVAAGEARVSVPLYPDSTDNVFTNYNYCNGADEYASDYYIAWYGTELVPQ